MENRQNIVFYQYKYNNFLDDALRYKYVMLYIFSCLRNAPLKLSTCSGLKKTRLTKTSVRSSRKYFVHVHWMRLAADPSWLDSSVGQKAV